MTIYSHLDLFHLGKNWDIIDCFSNTNIIFIKLIVSQNNSDWNEYFGKKNVIQKVLLTKSITSFNILIGIFGYFCIK